MDYLQVSAIYYWTHLLHLSPGLLSSSTVLAFPGIIHKQLQIFTVEVNSTNGHVNSCKI